MQMGLKLNQWGATSLIDISDGLSTELNHISEASNVGFQIDLDKIPKHPLVLKAAKVLKKDPLDLILNGGEDYELLGTLSEKAFKKTRGLIVIGKITREKKKTLKARGFDHFSV
jgi:thiamine-monophosphate kinase